MLVHVLEMLMLPLGSVHRQSRTKGLSPHPAWGYAIIDTKNIAIICTKDKLSRSSVGLKRPRRYLIEHLLQQAPPHTGQHKANGERPFKTLDHTPKQHRMEVRKACGARH